MITNEHLNEIAMKIILYAGNGRDCLSKAVKHIGETKIRDELIINANEEILKAHIEQTKVIQELIEDESSISTLLFTHAQDTIMTINSEYNTYKCMFKIYDLLREEMRGTKSV